MERSNIFARNLSGRVNPVGRGGRFARLADREGAFDAFRNERVRREEREEMMNIHVPDRIRGLIEESLGAIRKSPELLLLVRESLHPSRLEDI